MCNTIHFWFFDSERSYEASVNTNELFVVIGYLYQWEGN